jgi:dTDP-glucose 4,6-dehydratase
LLSEEHTPVNIGNPVEMSMIELAQSINDTTQNTAGIVFKENMRLGDDPERRRPDISKAKKLMDWEPLIDLKEALQLTIPYFKEKLSQL